MSQLKNFNHPLVRELQEIGVLSVAATPEIVGDIGDAATIGGVLNVVTEAFDGDASGVSHKLLQNPVGMVSVAAFPLDGSAYKIPTLVRLTNYDFDGTAFIFMSNLSAFRMQVTYTY